VKYGKHEGMHTPHFSNRVERRAQGTRNTQHTNVPKEKFPHRNERRSASNSVRQTQQHEFAAETANLRHMLAKLYPELVRSQNFDDYSI
jgi:hypothetical protein